MTPIRRQYLKIKHSYPDAIVLFRLGDFYETFDDDARLASQELEITLTSRNMGKDQRVPMAGVPAHSLENYLARLVKKGHQVAICEQLTHPSASRGLVERDVVRVVTPGTVLESGLLDQVTNNFLAAVVFSDRAPGRCLFSDGGGDQPAGGQAGLAYVDISTGAFAAVQLDISQLGLELERISPTEVLVPRDSDPPLADPESLGEAPPWLPPSPAGQVRRVTQVDPAVFDGDAARQALLSHYEILSLESFGVEGMPLAVCAAGAVIDYLAATQKTGKPQLSNLAAYSTAKFMSLDSQTRRNLELFSGGGNASKDFSLRATLDLTKTAMGGRLLRQWLGQPLLDLPKLEQRLDAVSYFFGDGFRRAKVSVLLSRIPDLERIQGRVSAGVVPPRELKSLQAGLEALPGLMEELGGFSAGSDEPVGPQAEVRQLGGNEPVAWLAGQLAPLPDLVQLIDGAIAQEPAGEVGEGNVIRDGFSAELDELKRASRDARGFIAGLEQKERDRTGIRNLRVGYNQVFGYYIEVTKSSASLVPDDYIRRQTLVNAERYIIPELKEYESLVLNARERLEELEQAIYRQVCRQIAAASPAVAKRAAAVAQVDVFTSLAEVAVRNNYVRPQLSYGGGIDITAGRHPVVEQALDPGAFVPNDVYLSTEDARVAVLTGPNMAGKSTFIRQVALIILMAQIGSYVPATQAKIGLVDRVFTRVGLHDDLAAGQSTFMVEMVETAAILNQATSRSLVILDEIGRGTSTYDGLSIARSVVEHLHNDSRLGCKTLFATHYHELTELARTLPGVRNLNVAVAEEAGRVVFLHRIVPGGADKSYGVHVAQLAGLPRGVINRAWEVLDDLERGASAGKKTGSRRSRPSTRSGDPARQMPLFSPDQPLAEEIRGLDIPNLTPLEAINILYDLQRKAHDGGEAL